MEQSHEQPSRRPICTFCSRGVQAKSLRCPSQHSFNNGAPRMKKTLIATLLLSSLACCVVHADDASSTNSSTKADANGDWTGTGELGFASTTGNTRSQNLNAKLNMSQETAQ